MLYWAQHTCFTLSQLNPKINWGEYHSIFKLLCFILTYSKLFVRTLFCNFHLAAVIENRLSDSLCPNESFLLTSAMEIQNIFINHKFLASEFLRRYDALELGQSKETELFVLLRVALPYFKLATLYVELAIHFYFHFD